MKKTFLILLMALNLTLPIVAQQQKRTLSNDDFGVKEKPAINIPSLDCTAISKAGKANAVLYDGAVLRPDNIGLRVVTNRGGTKQLSENRYEDSSVREIINEAKSPLSIWLFTAILGNKPSDYRTILNGKEIKSRLFKNLAEWQACTNINIDAPVPDRPNIFVPLGELLPGEKLRIEVIYQAEGHIVYN